jgi:hypothetical protein
LRQAFRRRTRVAATFVAVALAVLVVAAVSGATDGFVDPSASSTTVAAGSSKTLPETLHLDGPVDGTADPADIVLAFDKTVSMGEQLATAKTDAHELIASLAGSDVRYAVSEIFDYPDFDAGIGFQQIRSFDSDTSADSAVDSIAADNTASGPEAYFGFFDSLQDTETYAYAEGARRFLVVFGDQTGHDPNQSNFDANCPDDPSVDVADSGGAAGTTRVLAATGITMYIVSYPGTDSPATISQCHAALAGATGGKEIDPGNGKALGDLIAQSLQPVRDVPSFGVDVEVQQTVDDVNPSAWITFQKLPESVTVPQAGMDVPFEAVVSPPPDAPAGTYTVDLVANNDGIELARQTLTFTVVEPLANLALTVDEESVPAGVKEAPLGSIPPDRLALAAGTTPTNSRPIGSAPISSTPIASTPISSTPIASTPISSTPIASTGLLDAPISSTPISSTPLDHVLLSQINLKGTTWDDVLCAPLKGKPLNALTLGDLAADTGCSKTNFQSLTLGQVDLSTTLFKGVRWASLLWGKTTFGQLPVPPGFSSWSAALGGAAIVDDDTPLGADIGGVIGSSSRIGSTPIASTPISSTPIASTPIASTPIASTHITSSRLGEVKVADMNPAGQVVNCTIVDCAPGTVATLGSAYTANGILPTATFGSPALYPALQAADITMNDVVVALLAASDFPWEQLPVQGLQSVAGTGENATYHLSVGVDCSVVDDFQASVTLPDGFFPVAGTSTLSFGGGAQVPTDDPTPFSSIVIEGPPPNEYTWSIECPGDTTAVTDAVLTFQAYAGLTLGTQTSSASVRLARFVDSVDDTAPIDVTQNWEANEDSTTAPQIAPDELEVGHIGASGDQDFYRLPLSGLPRGTRISVYLSHIPFGADFDLTVGKPSAQGFFSTPIASTPIASTPIEDNGVTVDNTGTALPSEALQDIAVGSTPIASTPIASTSTTRGNSDEVAQFITQGESGFATIGVTGYNGSRSDSPYVVRVRETPPPALPANCPAPAFIGGPPSSFPAGTLPGSVATSTKALFIVNKQRLTALYGATPVNTMLTALQTLASRSDVGGTILYVDGNKAVRDAYAAWDAARCSVDAANAVVRSINDVIAGYRATNGLPSLKYVVLLGNDDSVPMYRTPDPVTLSPELNEANDLAFTTAGLTQGNPLYASAATNNILGDGAYGTLTAIPWLGHDLMLPQLSVARLVEQPADITAQINAYVAQNGVVKASGGGVVTGYDFLADGAKAVQDNVTTTFPSTGTLGGHPSIFKPGDDPTTAWTSDDAKTGFLRNLAASPGLGAINGHYNHYELEAADGSLAAASDAIIDATGRILFTMGCHGGLNVPGSTGQAQDWAEVWGSKKVAMYLANTGYGYGDSASVALSERLMALFAKNLHSDAGTVGEQWVNALHQYFATAGAYDVYDEKVMAETTFYGLPFWHFQSPANAPPPPLLPTATDPATGSPAATVPFNPTSDQHDQHGLYRPILKLRSQEVTSAAGPARGLWISALTTNDTGAPATIGYPTVDLAAHEPKPNVAPIFFPASPFTLEHSTAFGKTRDFVNVSDQFRPGAGSPTRTVTAATFKVLYGFGSDTSPPLISLVNVDRDGSGSTVISARIVDDAQIKDVAALVLTDNPVWALKILTQSPDDPTLYVSQPFTTTVDPEVFVEATDGTNVSYSANKGRNFTSLTSHAPAGPRILVRSPLGPYVQGQAVNASYRCDPNPADVESCVGTVPTGASVDTTTPGVHTFVVSATDADGHDTSLVRTYIVQLPFKGFFAPVDNEPTVNVVNSGRAIPVKFSLGGDRGLDIFAQGYPKSQQVGCDTEAPTTAVESTVTAGQSSLSYDAGNDQYNYIWKTDAGWANTCRILVLKLRDGSVHEAKFKFKK